MSGQSKVIDMASLKRAERIYRTRLANEPGDTTARVKLAWCLFMQALYRAGQESMLMALVSPIDETENQHSQRMKLIWGQDADQLLDECLDQAVTAMEFSPDPKDRMDVEKLKSLVTLSGVSQATAQAEDAANRLRAEFLQDLMRE